MSKKLFLGIFSLFFFAAFSSTSFADEQLNDAFIGAPVPLLKPIESIQEESSDSVDPETDESSAAPAEGATPKENAEEEVSEDPSEPIFQEAPTPLLDSVEEPDTEEEGNENDAIDGVFDDAPVPDEANDDSGEHPEGQDEREGAQSNNSIVSEGQDSDESSQDDPGGVAVSPDADFNVGKPESLPKPTPLPNPSGNLVPNPGFEVAGTAGLPQSWIKGGWGNNTAQYSYPAFGRTGKGASVEITSYTDGDAKWFFEEVQIEGGAEYTYSNYYNANIETIINAQFRLSNGQYSYVDFGAVAASSSWKKFEKVFMAPTNATHVTIFHLVNRVGKLTMDDVSLIKGSSSSFSQGMVSLTFDDGWNSHYVNALPILADANMKASFYIISDEMLAAPPIGGGGNLISNGSFESQNGNVPLGWFSNNWGSNTANFSYPAVGISSSKAAKVQVTSYADGDAKWIFNEVPVEAGKTYVYSDMYKSNISTEVDIQYKNSAGAYTYAYIDTVPAATTWTRYEKEITIPQGVVSISIFHSLVSTGELTIDDVSLVSADGGSSTATIDLNGYMNIDRVIEVENLGHEIGSHTLSHVSLTTVSETEAKRQIEKSRNDLLAAGIKTVETFVYPYGDYDNNVIQWVKDAGYKAARSVIRGYNRENTNPYVLEIQQVDRNTTRAQVQEWIAAAEKNNTWLILMFHQIDDSGDFYGSSPALLRQITTDIKSAGLRVVTMSEGVDVQ